MVFLGYAFYSGANSVELTPTNVGDMTRLEVTNASYNDVYVTRNPKMSVEDLPQGWDNYTELYGKYNLNIHAGNIEYTTRTIDTILIKRRKKGTFKWITILVKQAESVDDLKHFTGYDFTAASQTTYEYALVPAYQQTENVYYISEVDSEFEGVHIVEKDEMFGTIVDTTCEVTRNAPSAVVELINNKYPKYTSNTIANYDTGTATGQFVDMGCKDESGCYIDYKLISSWVHRNNLLAFLTNRKPKILKYETGAIWLVNITGAPTDTAKEEGLSEARIVSFEWAETGDYEDEASLYYAGLSDVPSIWWNK